MILELYEQPCWAIGSNSWRTSEYTYAEALAMSKTLVNCVNCTDCERCTNCVDCAYCEDCTDCNNAKNCHECTGYRGSFAIRQYDFTTTDRFNQGIVGSTLARKVRGLDNVRG